MDTEHHDGHPEHHDGRPEPDEGDRVREVPARTGWREVFVRACLFGFGWWVLTGFDPDSWLIGLPSVSLATLASLWLVPCRCWRLRWAAVPRFLLVFGYYSWSGGLDVASRAIRPSLPLSPGMIPFALRLPPGTARVFFANIVSLSPGTLSADIRGDTLLVHALARHLPVVGQLRRLEASVEQLFDCTSDISNAGGAGEP